MSEPKITTEQDLIDKGAFPEGGLCGFKKNGENASHQTHYWTGLPEQQRMTLMGIQLAVWAAALHWERTSPFSASNKRIKQLESIIE